MRVRDGVSMRWQRVPPGLRDLPPAAAERQRALAAALLDEFRRWGYREVRTPALEYLETITRGAGAGVADQLFKIVDRGGEILALRPELTVPIARLAATRLAREAGGPLRLAYAAEVFRGSEAGGGRLREFTQAGVELLGDGSPGADAETVALAAACLRRTGVPGAAVHVGHAGFLGEMLAALPLEMQDGVRTRLYRKEFAGIEDGIPESLGRLLRRLPDLHGPNALDTARALAGAPGSRAALDDLAGLITRLDEYGVGAQVRVDLSIIRDFGYYTGVVFEAYGGGGGYPVLGGGRYDALLTRFGVDWPATGFAIGLERLLDAQPDQPAAPAGALLLGPHDRRESIIRLAAALRERGVTVVLAMGVSWIDGIARSRVEGLRWVAEAGADRCRLLDTTTDRESVVRWGDLGAAVAPPDGPRVIAWTH